MSTIRLVCKDGYLYYPDDVLDQFGEPGPIVLCVYDTGECDTIKWPRYNERNLRSALYGDREGGIFGDHTQIELPNGRQFSIDS